ncbi:hypothetical protein A2382_04850 [Candidatus Woesebacteria bacterium RIFOXYB1_FULL_38_16]|uniref:BioF2-like acetyltransferase domain-containing protein n=1 Tax=Candidatus Woesebacteria bacterium RIFOXYB1_FULL_38_16 TaxID=1802538 RepID=A0A1F8CUI7_9BACT|nr:MAG: hypothetical protein A2191_00315 [Candidatus Woesebacteria bacterium RIFOXYA1_FULL_38_9]OGM79987.1 MAG: hypothetical protein A2382_04850 [Candidatus Woesebacteria bacterium RIFOXYB1_FULL_38_16]
MENLPTHPLQSPEWTEFRKEWGNTTLKTPYGYINIHSLSFIKYKVGMFIRGPEPNTKMLEYLRQFAHDNNLIFIKLEPFSLNSKSDQALLRKHHCLPGKTLFTPSSFWIDLTKSENELLQSFSGKTRYNIRLAQKKGVTVHKDNSDKAFEKYLRLTSATVARQRFYAHNKHYHQLMWQHLKNKIAYLLVAKYKGEIITTWILFVYKGFLYYPYGAASLKHKNVMANNLMLWEAIRFGKSLKLKTFDLWGREKNKGFTRFKEGYNPRVVEFIGTWDLVANYPLYYMFRLFDFMRWLFLRTKSNFTSPRF